MRSIREIVVIFFFFQAEDGIRDAQESRGLGDVYKRQTGAMAVADGLAVALADIGQAEYGLAIFRTDEIDELSLIHI